MKICDKTNEQLTAFVLGYFSEEEVSDMTRHLAECEDCRVKVREHEKLLECAREISEISADEQMCKSAKGALLAVAEGAEKARARPIINIQNIWRIIMKSPITKLAAAAVIAIVVLGGISFWPGDSDSGKWWLGPPKVWAQEILAELSTIKAVTCREQYVKIYSDGSEHKSMTWSIFYISHDSYRTDFYDGDFLREIQWCVPHGDDTLQHSIYYDVKSYFTQTHKGSFGNQDTVGRMRSYVSRLDIADQLLGEEVIDGRNCVGFEISQSKVGDNPSDWIDCIWFDTETKLPVRIEQRGRPITDKPDRTLTTIQDQFDYNPDLSADTFIPKIPEGFIFGHPDDLRKTD